MTGSRRLSASVPRVSGNGSEASPRGAGQGTCGGCGPLRALRSFPVWVDRQDRQRELGSAPAPRPGRLCAECPPGHARAAALSTAGTERRPAAAPSRSGGRGDDGAHVVRGRALLLRAQKGVCSGRGLSPLPVGERRLSRPPSPSPTTLDYRRKKRREQPERARPRQAGLGPLWEREHCGPKR